MVKEGTTRLHTGEVPDPEPQADELFVRVRATARLVPVIDKICDWRDVNEGAPPHGRKPQSGQDRVEDHEIGTGGTHGTSD
ncbi:hypothetical protein BSNK01_07640 [Bacillaceae bacterium]